MRYRILLLLLLLLPAWAVRAQAPTWQSVTGLDAGAGLATVRGTAIDANGDYYVVGYFYGSLNLGGTILTTTDPTTDADMFVAKMSGTTNTWLWAKQGGGTGVDQAGGVTVSGTTVYVTGFYTTAATISGTALTSVGGQDIFVARYTTAGANGTAVGGGGGSSDQGYDVVANGSNVYITGFMTTNATTPVIAGSTLTGAGGQDIFVARYTDNGTNLIGGGARSGGSSSSERGRGVAVSGSSVYVTGQFLNTATISGTSLTSLGSLDMFVAKYTDTGSGLAENGAIRGGGSAGSDIGYNITAVGSSPTILYVGSTFNNTATISGTSLTAAGGSQDVYLARFTDSGSGVTNGYARSDGGANSDVLNDLAVSGTTLYAAGSYTTSTTLAGSNLTSNGDDAFVAKYTDNGSSFVSVGAIDGGADATGVAPTFAGTIATNGTRTLPGRGSWLAGYVRAHGQRRQHCGSRWQYRVRGVAVATSYHRHIHRTDWPEPDQRGQRDVHRDVCSQRSGAHYGQLRHGEWGQRDPQQRDERQRLGHHLLGSGEHGQRQRHAWAEPGE